MESKTSQGGHLEYLQFVRSSEIITPLTLITIVITIIIIIMIIYIYRYKQNQEYQPHFDFGMHDKNTMRFSTLLMYLRNAPHGGTSFPLAEGRRGISVLPPPGSGVLFYSQTPDGNGDLNSLHAGLLCLNHLYY